MEGVILHLAGDGELVAVEDDPLQVGQQVGLGGGGGTPLGDLTGQHVQLLTGVTTGARVLQSMSLRLRWIIVVK